MRMLLLSSLLFFNYVYLQAQADSTANQTVSSVTIYFPSGESNINQQADTTMQELLNQLDGQLDSMIITAHTDSIGNEEANQKLSQQRAATVKARLIANGIPDTLLFVRTFGEHAPIAANQFEEGRQQNRRANITAYAHQTRTTIYGQVIDAKTKAGLLAQVTVQSAVLSDSIQTDLNGNFQLSVPLEIDFRMDFFAENYFFNSVVQSIEKEVNIKRKYPLKRIEAGASINLKQLLFVGGKAELLTISKPYLPTLLKFMQANPQVKIEIAGHVNITGDSTEVNSASHMLSVARAKTVHDYLLENGISKDRMTYKGYGNWQMRFPNPKTTAQNAANRRVELKVLAVE